MPLIMGNLEGARIPGTLKDELGGLWKWSISLCGSSMGGTWREGSFTGDPKGYAK